MLQNSLDKRIDLHRAFWNREEQEYPLAAFRVAPDFFFARHYTAARDLLVDRKRISPEMLIVEDFAEDYERMFSLTEEIGQDAFWTAEPYVAIPWMEAILGCDIHASEAAFISESFLNAALTQKEIDSIEFDPENPWLKKYLDFTRMLVDISRGRFPVGMPIMRGPSDMVGALMGQTEMVYALADEPELMKRFFLKVTDVFLKVINEQKKIAGKFLEGEAMGFYHVYCPGSCIWFQEDLSAILSPDLYREFLAEPAENICRDYDYTSIHLHPASFFVVDELLKNEGLSAIEVNKDVGGPSVEEMIPTLRKIIDKKNLILWGDLTPEDLEAIRKNLPAQGLFFHIVAPDAAYAQNLLQIIRSWKTQ